MANKNKPVELKVNSGTYRGSIYSQIVGVTVTDVDITLEFVYVHPRNKDQGEVVSRVTLPRAVGSELSKTIADTIAKNEASRKKS